MALFRAGHDEAFRVIHDRYHQRLFAYTRQMLPGCRQDAEDALQDVFVRAYAGLRSSDRELALRAWLYRVAHNRCIDELRRPAPPGPELLELVRPPIHDPIAEAEQRESLRRLIADLRRLPQHQRSALLMRELSGMTYSELADALGVSVPAVKSLLVRARIGLAQALEARETACSEIHDELVLAHDRRVRPNATARRHMRDCAPCRQFHGEIRGMSKQFAALLPALGPFGLLANLLGFGGAGGGAAAGSSAAAGGGAALAGGAAGTGGAFAAGGVLATGAGHIATLLAAAVVTAGGAVEIQGTLSVPVKHRTHHHANSAATAHRGGSVLARPSESVAAVPAASPATVESPAPAPAPAAVTKPARAVLKAPKSVSPSAGSQNGAGSMSKTSGASGGSPADAGAGTGGSGTSASSGTTTGTSSGDGTQAPGASSSTSGTPANTTGAPTDGSSGTLTLGATGTASPSGTTGTQGGSPASTSATVSTTVGSDSGTSSTGAGTGPTGASH